MVRAVGGPGVRAVGAALAVLLLAVLLLVVGASGASADDEANLDDFSFASLDVDYTLSRAEDGTSRLAVVETFVAEFPETDQNRGMRRTVPDTYLGAPLFPRLVSITDENGDPRPEDTDSEDGYYAMTSRADDFVHGEQTYVFRYTLENVTRFFDDTDVDELYWNVNGTEWAQTFGRTSMTLTMDAALAEQLTGDASCYIGREGSDESCQIVMDAAPGDVTATAGPTEPFETMTVAVAFERGTFTAFDTSYLASPFGWLQGIAGLGMLGAVVAAIVIRRRKLGDGPGRPTVVAEFTPPPAIDALESAVLLQRTGKAIPAEVLEQAVVGSIRIVEGEKPRRGGQTPLRAVLVDASLADADGRMLLDGLFPEGVPGGEFEFGRSDTRFSSAAQGIIKAATAEIKARGLRREVSLRARVVPILLACIAAAAAFVFGIIALQSGVSPAVPVIVLVTSGILVFVVAGLLARVPLTAKGAETRDHLEGLRVFIEWAEADRIRMLQSPSGAERASVDTNDSRQMLRLYERLLPYAVVFGQEKEWSEQLAVLYGPSGAPSWYAGMSVFNAAAFSSGISTLSTSTASSSSTSGGSAGGGGAGGGGGGGGGGGV